MSRCYLTTAPAGLGAGPKSGPAVGLVQADVLARHHRMRGARVRFAAGAGPELAGAREPLALSFTEVIGIEDTDPRHRSGADRLWRACAAAGDVHREPGAANEVLRLSHYAERLGELISRGELRIEPAGYRAEVLDVVAAGLPDAPVSPALAGYLTGLAYGTDGPHYRRWWLDGDRRSHVIGAETLLAHAVHWPAMLLSAGLPLPTDILVHGELGDVDVVDLARRFGADAVRWWLLRELPQTGNAEFTAARLVDRVNRELAAGLGGLVDRSTIMVHRYRDGYPPTGTEPDAAARPLATACQNAPDQVHAALTAFDFHRATEAVWRIVEEANRYLQRARPWDLARAEQDGDTEAGRRLDAVLAELLATCRALANQLIPVVPVLAQRITEQCVALSGPLRPPRPLFLRLRS